MTEIGIKNQDYSVDLCFTGITRQRAAEALADFFGTAAEHLGGTYDTWMVKDAAERTWKLTYDPLVSGEWKIGNVPTVYKAPSLADVDSADRAEVTAAVEGSFYPGRITAKDLNYLTTRNHAYRTRLESPMLSYGDMDQIADCMGRIQGAGAKVNSSCEMSVHVDASNHNRQSLKNLVGIMYSKEDILFRALQVDEHRAEVYSKKVREPLVQQMRKLSCDETKDMTELEAIWYDGTSRPDQPLNKTCRYALNLHSAFFRNTVEWRCFNATFQPERAAAYVNLCLAMSAQAITQRSTVLKKTASENEQFTFRTFLVRLGLNGDEFKETRDLLLENLEGNKAWLRPKTPEGGRKKKKREAVR